MTRFSLFFLSSLFLLCPLVNPLYASKAKPFKSAEDADAYLFEHYNRGSNYYNEGAWRKASTEFEKVIYFFPCSEEAAKASYYLAVSYFEMKEYDFANEEFSNYLKASQHPEFFEDAVYYKFCIAEYFKAGKKKRPFKMRYLPKWISAQDSALAIYDEVVAALPNHDLTIQALQSKAELLCTMNEYRDCIETYQLIIRRFPKNEIIPTCYLKIAETYYEQSRYEFQNPDILALAELNVRKFKDDYPRDEGIGIAEQTVCRIKELYAKGLCDLGLFYQRMGKPEAAAIYFQSSIEEFPDTKVARFCRSRLNCMGYNGENECPCTDEIPTASLKQEEVFNLSQDSANGAEDRLKQTQINDTAARGSQPSSGAHYYEDETPNNRASDFANEGMTSQEHVPVTAVPSQSQVIDQWTPEEISQSESPQGQQHSDEENSPYYYHYSQFKQREQHVAPSR